MRLVKARRLMRVCFQPPPPEPPRTCTLIAPQTWILRYISYTSDLSCGIFDDSDFTASEMCCVCQGVDPVDPSDDYGVCSVYENGKECSDAGFNWCCDKDSNYPTCGNSRGICEHKSAKKTAKKVAMGLIIGVVVAALAVLGGIIACCFCCAGCPGYKSRHPQGAAGAPPCIEDQPTAVVEMSAK